MRLFGFNHVTTRQLEFLQQAEGEFSILTDRGDRAQDAATSQESPSGGPTNSLSNGPC